MQSSLALAHPAAQAAAFLWPLPAPLLPLIDSMKPVDQEDFVLPLLERPEQKTELTIPWSCRASLFHSVSLFHRAYEQHSTSQVVKKLRKREFDPRYG